MTLDDLRQQGLTPDPDQRLDEYYPVVDQPEKEFGQPFMGSGLPSECGIFVQAHGHVKVEVLQYPYTDLGFTERYLPEWEREGTAYFQGDAKVVLPPTQTATYDDRQIAEALIISPTARAIVKIVGVLGGQADPAPIVKGLAGAAIPRLSEPPTREMELSYSESDGDEPDACDVLSAADVEAALKGPADGFVHRRADLAETRIVLNNGDPTYFTNTVCERALAPTGAISFHVAPQVSFTLRTYRDAARAEATMRQKLDPHGSSFGPPVVLARIGDDLGMVTAPAFDDREVVFRVGRYIGELDYRDGTESAESPDVLAHRLTPVAQAIAHRLR